MRTKPLDARAAHLLVFDPGDDALATLTAFAEEHSVEGASFSGIGAFERATVAWWNPRTREYESVEITEQVEVLAIAGNIARSGDEVKIHAHVTLSRRDGSAIGGHLLAGRVFPTLEVLVSEFEGRLRRDRDEATRLWLLKP